MVISYCNVSLPVDDIKPWMIWGYWISPMMYGQNAIAINEFLDERWSAVRLENTFLFTVVCSRADSCFPCILVLALLRSRI